MRIRSLEITDFRRIAACRLSFGAGLNVLYGPNELGKSTLAEALRAVLLTPTTSSAVHAYRPWGTDAVPEVTIVFDHAGTTWRLQKRFALGTRSHTLLERATESGAFQEAGHARGADGKVRELLAWGLPQLGGRGRVGSSETFLTAALLATQGEADAILKRNLESDADGSGRALITAALDALGQHPMVKQILDRLQETIDAAYTDTGRHRRSASSPLVESRGRITEQEARIAGLGMELARSQEVEAEVRSLRGRRDHALSALEVAQSRVHDLEEKSRRWAERREEEDEVARAEAELERIVSHENTIAEDLAKLRKLDELCATSEFQLRDAQAAEGHAAEARAAVLERIQAMRSAERTAAAVAIQTRERKRLELAHAIDGLDTLAQEARRAAETEARARELNGEATVLEERLRAAEDALRGAGLRVALAEAEARLREAKARDEARRLATAGLDGALSEEAQARAALLAAREAEAAAERSLADQQAAASGGQRRAGEFEAARTRLVDLESKERKLRDRLDRQRVIDAKREALARVTEQRDTCNRHVESLREALERNAREADTARARARVLEGVLQIRELQRLRGRLSGLEQRRARADTLREEQVRLRCEADARAKEAEERGPATAEEIERLRTLVRDQETLRTEEPKSAPVPFLACVVVGLGAGALAFVGSGLSLGFGRDAALIGSTLTVLAFGIATFVLRRRALADSRRTWEARLQESNARWAADGESRLRASGASDVDALEAFSRTATRLREEARAAAVAAERLELEIRNNDVSLEQVEDTRRAVDARTAELAGNETLERQSGEIGDDAAVAREMQATRHAIEDLDGERSRLREELAEVKPTERALILQIEATSQELSVLHGTSGTDAASHDTRDLAGALQRLQTEAQALRGRLGLVDATEPEGEGSGSEPPDTLDALREARDAARATREAAQGRFDEARARTVEARTRLETAEEAAKAFDVEGVAEEVAAGRSAMLAGGCGEMLDSVGDPASARSALELVQSSRHDTRRALEAKRALAGAEQARASSLVDALGCSPEDALAAAEVRRATHAAELAALESARESSPAATAGIDDAALADAERELEDARNRGVAAKKGHEAARRERDMLQGRLDAQRRAVPVRPTAEAHVAAARERVSQLPEVEPVAEDALEAARALEKDAAHAVTEAEGRLREAQGQLQLLGGVVIADRCREAHEKLGRLRQAHEELERHLAGHRLLAETLRRFDAERSSHLGCALAKPVTERFLSLVGGPYTGVRIGATLQAEGVEAAGELRTLDLLSVGTRDQLATLVRLAIAEHLKTALLLDDQLTQSDATRMRWLREVLRAVAQAGTQILVLTCRPHDYLDPPEFPTAEDPAKDSTLITAIDLARALTARAAS